MNTMGYSPFGFYGQPAAGAVGPVYPQAAYGAAMVPYNYGQGAVLFGVGDPNAPAQPSALDKATNWLNTDLSGKDPKTDTTAGIAKKWIGLGAIGIGAAIWGYKTHWRF